MAVDLKGDWTDADIAKLIGSVVDDRDWRLEVSTDGIASLVDKTAHPTDDAYDNTLHCFLETWMKLGSSGWSCLTTAGGTQSGFTYFPSIWA